VAQQIDRLRSKRVKLNRVERATDIDLPRYLRASGPAGIDDVLQIGLAGEQVVGFLNGDCGLSRIDVPVPRRSSRLDVQRELGDARPTATTSVLLPL
jgi:hypothetical protein